MIRLRLVACVPLLLAAGCLAAPTDVTPTSVIVRGSWNYSSVQAGGLTTTSGTLTLSQDSTVRFTGTLDANEQDSHGQIYRIAAVISGHTIDESLVEFDLVVNPTNTRRHSGVVSGDSLIGTWVQLSDVGVAASGTFRAMRIK
jgi:hypothetical protein